MFYRKINGLKLWVERDERIINNNEKIRFLSYIENLLKQFRIRWRMKEFNPIDFPALEKQFEDAMNRHAAGESLVQLISNVPYAQASILADVFQDSPESRQLNNAVYLKFANLYPERSCKTIRPYVNEPFADSLVVIACRRDPCNCIPMRNRSLPPKEGSFTGIPTVRLLPWPNSARRRTQLMYFPFLDNLLSGKQTIGDIRKIVGDGEKGYDSVAYYKLLVKRRSNMPDDCCVTLPTRPLP